MNWVIFLVLVAGIIHLLTYILYIKKILNQDSKPNTTSWMLWSFLSFLGALSYNMMTGDFLISLLSYMSFVGCLLTFIFLIFKGKFSFIDFWDLIALIIGVISGFVWWYFRSATGANLILQLAIVISFIPTYRGLWHNPTNESPTLWYIWFFVCCVMFVVVLLRWQGHYEYLVSPINSCLLHIIAATLARRKI